jgi:hypothetical protein
MPKRLPLVDIITGMFKTVLKAIKFWLHSTLVAISWLGIVPLTASRIYRCLFTGSVSSLLTLPLDMLSTENIISDIFQGGFVVLCSLGAFISLVWLREQILSGGGPDWLENNNNNNNNDQRADQVIVDEIDNHQQVEVIKRAFKVSHINPNFDFYYLFYFFYRSLLMISIKTSNKYKFYKIITNKNHNNNNNSMLNNNQVFVFQWHFVT